MFEYQMSLHSSIAMRPKKSKKGRVPNLLWKQFNNRAATLSKTILSLIPNTCNCNLKGKCLRCVFSNGVVDDVSDNVVDDDAALSYLIRPNDPSEFRDFMSSCFVVVSPNAPPLSPLTSFTRLWSLLQIVEKAIRTSRTEAPTNVICHGYEKLKLHSDTVKALTSPTWELVLKRVGDSVMFYLLMHTLIFMPMNYDAYHQVAGPPVNQFPARLPINMHSRCRQKRRRPNGEISNLEEPVSKVAVKSDPRNSIGSVSCRNKDELGTQCSAMSTLMPDNCSDGHVPEETLVENLEENLGKRLRMPSWQRKKRRKRLMLQDSGMQEPSRKVLNDESYQLKINQHGSLNKKCQSPMLPTWEKSINNHRGTNLTSKQQVQLCPCCSVFKTLSSVPKGAEIKRRLTFYNMNSSSSLFLKKHVLYSLKSGFSGVHDLLLRIFGLPNMGTPNSPASCFHNLGLCSHRSYCLYHSLLKFLRVFIRRATKCQHKRLLEKHCPSPSLSLFDDDGNVGSTLQARKAPSEFSNSQQDVNQRIKQLPKRPIHTMTTKHKKITEVIQHQFDVSRPYCLKDEVVSFVWSVCQSIIPADLLGSPSSRRTLRRNISRFIRLRRFEKFSLKQCLHKLDASKFPFLSKIKSLKFHTAFSFEPEAKQFPRLSPKSQTIHLSYLKQMLLERWIFWFFTQIIVPLVQAKFYVTESEHGKQNLYYYRKSTWRKLSDRVTETLKDQSYHCLDTTSVAGILRNRSFGFSKVRLCPKENGARPIANLKAPSRFRIRKSSSRAWLSKKQKKGTFLKSVNSVLQDIHVIFKDLKAREPKRWGSTVDSYDDIHRKLCSFLRHLKRGKETMPAVYIVVADVQKAFDTVKQDKLLSILHEIQVEDKDSQISRDLKLFQGNNSEFLEVVLPVHQRSCQKFVFNQEQSMTLRWERLKLILKEHLKRNVLKLGQCFYLQTVGIPQGSVISTLLCTLYYGHMERSVIFPYLAKVVHAVKIQSDNDNDNDCALASTLEVSSFQYLLLRFVDDFLLVSTSKMLATNFFARLRRGVRKYNCFMNQEKFCTNFDSEGTHKLDPKRQLVGSDGVHFLKWSGLLINSRNLEVQADHSRYLNDHLSSTMTVNCQRRPGRQLQIKLFAYLRPKCHPILFDTCINSPATIRLNIYQAFVICAMKFHCYVRALSFWRKLQPRSCLSRIMKSLRYMYSLLKRKMNRVKCLSGCHHVLQVAKKEVIWLGLKAYIRVLSKKKSRHIDLLRLLKHKFAASSVAGSTKLKFAVDDSHSSYLWKIKY